MSFVDSLYYNVYRRSSTLALSCVVGAFIFERGFDALANTIFERINRGKLWKDICHKYVGNEEE